MNDETNNLFLRYTLSLSLNLIYILHSPFTLWTDMYSLYLSDFYTSFCRELSLSLCCVALLVISPSLYAVFFFPVKKFFATLRSFRIPASFV